VAIGSADRFIDDGGVLAGDEPLRDIAALWRRVLSRLGETRTAVPA
jgi:hypothetical protein